MRHGRVYREQSTWTVAHRRWLWRQQFDQPATAMAYGDLLAGVDGLAARKQAHALRISQLAGDESWWPTVARLRAFRAIDTLWALSVHLDWAATGSALSAPRRSARGWD